MPKTAWVLCKDCEWWQVEPDGQVASSTLGLCIEETLQPYLLRVSGDSGRNLFDGRRTGPRRGLQCGATHRETDTVA